jgi:hypothetical protein
LITERGDTKRRVDLFISEDLESVSPLIASKIP